MQDILKEKEKCLPPFPEVKLKNGDKLDCDSFPSISLSN